MLQSKVDGNGSMAWPYLSARIRERIYFDLRAAWGRSSNDFGVAAATARSIPHAGWSRARLPATGPTAPGASPHRPSSPTSRRARRLRQLGQHLGAGQDVSLGPLRVGPEFGYRIAHTPDMQTEPFAALKGEWDFHNPNVAIVDGLIVGAGDFWAGSKVAHRREGKWLECARARLLGRRRLFRLLGPHLPGHRQRTTQLRLASRTAPHRGDRGADVRIVRRISGSTAAHADHRRHQIRPPHAGDRRRRAAARQVVPGPDLRAADASGPSRAA